MKNSINYSNYLFSCEGNNEEHVIHSKGKNIEIMIKNKVDETVENTEFFQLLLPNIKLGGKHQFKLMIFVFDCVYLFYYKCQKINLNRGGSYVDALDWVKNKKATINSINKIDNKCFQYAATVSLNH